MLLAATCRAILPQPRACTDNIFLVTRLPLVREMQCRLSVSSVDEDVETAVEEHVHGLAGGKTPRRYAALSLGFKMAGEERHINPSGRRLNAARAGVFENQVVVTVRGGGIETQIREKMFDGFVSSQECASVPQTHAPASF